MALCVIGAGLGRTGTLSLKCALEQIGYGPCYHAIEFPRNPAHGDLWKRAMTDQSVDWEEIFSSYRATVDAPGCYVYRELARRYPTAKVVLTLREPNAWFESTQTTNLSPAFVEYVRNNPDLRDWETVWRGIFGPDLHKRESVIASFERHTADVRRSIPPDRLLVYEVKQGWEPLCSFLGVQVPGVPFPRLNSREEWPAFVERGQSMREAAKSGVRECAGATDLLQ